MRWTVAALLLPALALLALAGCGGDDELPSDVLAEFDVEGGIAGYSDELTIDRDGQVSSSGAECAFELEADEFERLEEALGEVDFSSLESDYKSENVADDLTDRVRYEEHAVEADGSAAPQELISVLTELGQIHAECLERAPGSP